MPILAWVGKHEFKEEYGITLKSCEALKILLIAEVQSFSRKISRYRPKMCSVDMIWINGENFVTMKKNGLLHGPFSESLPNYAKVDYKNKASIVTDFGVAVDQCNLLYG